MGAGFLGDETEPMGVTQSGPPTKNDPAQVNRAEKEIPASKQRSSAPKASWVARLNHNNSQMAPAPFQHEPAPGNAWLS